MDISSRKRLHSSNYDFLGATGLQSQVMASQQKMSETTAVDVIMNSVYVNMNCFETHQRIKILDDLIMRIVSAKQQVLLQSEAINLSTSSSVSLSSNHQPTSSILQSKILAKSPPRLPLPQLPVTSTTSTPSSSTTLTEQQFSDFQQNFLRQQLYSNVQYLPQYGQYQRVIPDTKNDTLIKFQQLVRESVNNGNGGGSVTGGNGAVDTVYTSRMMAPPRIAPTPIPAPPVLLPQVTKPEIRKTHLLPKVRPCNQWSVVSLPLPLAG